MTNVNNPKNKQNARGKPYHLAPLYQAIGISAQVRSMDPLNKEMAGSIPSKIAVINPIVIVGNGWYAANNGIPKLD